MREVSTTSEFFPVNLGWSTPRSLPRPILYPQSDSGHRNRARSSCLYGLPSTGGVGGAGFPSGVDVSSYGLRLEGSSITDHLLVSLGRGIYLVKAVVGMIG